jgi:hypothetical protein
MAWARLTDVGIFGVDLQLRSSEPTLAGATFEYAQPYLKTWLRGQLIAVSDGAGHFQLASQECRPLRRRLRITGWAIADGRRLTMHWRRAQDVGAPELTLHVEPGPRRYAVWIDRSQIVKIGTDVNIECENSTISEANGGELLGLLTYVWAMSERDRRAT